VTGRRASAVFAAAVMACGVLSATTASAAAQTKVISSCTKTVYKPSHYVFFCADAGAGLRQAAYSSWTATQADGSGIYYFNDCKPSCAGGTVHKEPAIFRLYRPVDTSQHGTLFTRIEVSTQKRDKVFHLPTKTISDY
jgi:hypothetical protein